MKEVLSSKQGIPFTQIANAVLVNKNISLKAKGLFAYIYSKPQTWDFAAGRMSFEMKESRDAIETALHELEEAGYLIRTRQGDGRMTYDISHDPMRENASQVKPLKGKIPHISNKDYLSNKKEESNKETAPQGDAVLPRADSFFNARKLKERQDEGFPMNLSSFVLMCRGSQYRHIRLIGEHADEKKPSNDTRGQWREFGRRNMRAARQLAPYTDRQIEKAFGRMQEDLKTAQSGRGFIGKWSMETIIKYLDEI